MVPAVPVNVTFGLPVIDLAVIKDSSADIVTSDVPAILAIVVPPFVAVTV